MKRRIKIILAAAAVLIGTALTTVACSGQNSPIRSLSTAEQIMFPEVSGMNLLKEPIAFPADIKGQPTLVLVAFFQRQQLEVNTWLDKLEEIESKIPGVQVIETPTISGAKWGWMAGYIDNAMRSGIPDTDARARTITLYTDVSAFREALELPTDQEIYAVMLDEDARVVATEAGTFTDAKLVQMANSVNQ